MKVTFCDLCGNPIKGNKFRMIVFKYVEEIKTNFDSEADEPAAYSQKKYIQEKEIEICPTCKEIIDNIFKQRMIGILKLAEDLKTIYSIPYKEPKNEKNDKKKKKAE